LLVAAIAAILAVAVFGGAADSRPDGLAFNGQELPTYVAGVADPAVGQKAPIFTTEYLDGDYAFIGGGGGPNDTAKLVLFVAHWCPTCQAEVPTIAGWVADNELPDGVEIVIVSTFADADRDNYPPADWFDAAGWSAPVVADSTDGEIAAQFGFSSVPAWTVLTNLNVVLDRGVGPLPENDLERLVNLAATSRG